MSPFRNADWTSVRYAQRAENTRSVSVAPASVGGTYERRTMAVEPDIHSVGAPTADHLLPQSSVARVMGGWPRDGSAPAGSARGRRTPALVDGRCRCPPDGFGCPDGYSLTRAQVGRRCRPRRHQVDDTLRGGAGGSGAAGRSRGAGGSECWRQVTPSGGAGHGRWHLGAAGQPGHFFPSRHPAGPPEARHRKASFGSPEVTAARWGRKTDFLTPRHGNHCARAQQGRGRVGEPPARSRSHVGPTRVRGLPRARRDGAACRSSSGRPADAALSALRRASARRWRRREPGPAPTGPWATDATGHGASAPESGARPSPRRPKGWRGDRRQGSEVLRYRAARRRIHSVAQGYLCRHEFLFSREIEGKVGARQGKSTERLADGRGDTARGFRPAGTGSRTVRIVVRRSGGGTPPSRAASVAREGEAP